MFRHLTLTAAALFLAGCAAIRFPSVDQPPPLTSLSVSPIPALQARIDSVIADSLFPPSNIGVKVVSLTHGQTLYALNEHMLFNPASNQKLVTSAAALRFLGPQADFATTVAIDSATRRLLIRGEGDPLLSTADLDSMARLCALQIPSDSSWTVGVDVRFFDDVYWGAGWTWDEEPAAYGMFLSPLVLNNNTITVEVTPGLSPGDPPEVSLDPPTAYVSVENSAVSVPDTAVEPLKISRKWRERSNTITVAGHIVTGSRPRRETLSLWRPELYAGTVFAERLHSYGILVDTIRIDSLTAGVPLVRFSHGIDTVLTFLNKVSDNLSAENVLKTIAARTFGPPGSAENGLRLVNLYLAEIGVDTNVVSAADGSGLSRYNLTSPATIVRLLETMYRDSLGFPLFYRALPIAGVDGTIGARMRGTTAEGNLRAKTGTLSAVTALSGYVRTADNEWLAFSILMQNFPGPSRRYRAVQDAIGVILATMKRGAL